MTRRKYHTSRSICCERRNQTYDVPSPKVELCAIYKAKHLIKSQDSSEYRTIVVTFNIHTRTICIKNQLTVPNHRDIRILRKEDTREITDHHSVLIGLGGVRRFTECIF